MTPTMTRPTLLLLFSLLLGACGGTVEITKDHLDSDVAAQPASPSGTPTVDCSRPVSPTVDCPDSVPYYWTCTVGDRYATDRETADRLNAILGDATLCTYGQSGRACCTF